MSDDMMAWPVAPQPNSLGELKALIAERERRLDTSMRHHTKVIWILIAIGTAGLLLPLVVAGLEAIFHIKAPTYLSDFIHELSMAGVIAAILGLVFERWFHQKALEDIAEAALGHLLPDEIKEPR